MMENVNEIADYKEFLNEVNATRKKLAAIDENIRLLNRETAVTTLEAVTMVHPKVLSYLHDIETTGRQMDKLVTTTQEMKNNLSQLATAVETKPIDYYTNLLNKLGLL